MKNCHLTFLLKFNKLIQILDLTLLKKQERYPKLLTLPTDLPPNRPGFDHEIPLLDNATVPPAKVYRMSTIAELEELRKQLDAYSLFYLKFCCPSSFSTKS